MQMNPISPVTGKRYKRTPEEVLADMEKVESLVHTGKYNQIEALHKVGLQSSVYHYKLREFKQDPVKSLKARKSPQYTDFKARKDALMKRHSDNANAGLHNARPTVGTLAAAQPETTPSEAPKAQETPTTEVEMIPKEIYDQLLADYNKLKDYVIETVVLKH